MNVGSCFFAFAFHVVYNPFLRIRVMREKGICTCFAPSNATYRAKPLVSQRGSTVEQLICNQWVAGSIPVAGSIKELGKHSFLTMSVPLFFFPKMLHRAAVAIGMSTMQLFKCPGGKTDREDPHEACLQLNTLMNRKDREDEARYAAVRQAKAILLSCFWHLVGRICQNRAHRIFLSCSSAGT